MLAAAWRIGLGVAPVPQAVPRPLPHPPPLRSLPWVFTWNAEAEGGEYDQMLRVAVASAIDTARLQPFCLFSGNATASPMAAWLRERGVTLVQARLRGRGGWETRMQDAGAAVHAPRHRLSAAPPAAAATHCSTSRPGATR